MISDPRVAGSARALGLVDDAPEEQAEALAIATRLGHLSGVAAAGVRNLHAAGEAALQTAGSEEAHWKRDLVFKTLDVASKMLDTEDPLALSAFQQVDSAVVVAIPVLAGVAGVVLNLDEPATLILQLKQVGAILRDSLIASPATGPALEHLETMASELGSHSPSAIDPTE
jgi:hypothetical protein